MGVEETYEAFRAALADLGLQGYLPSSPLQNDDFFVMLLVALHARIVDLEQKKTPRP